MINRLYLASILILFLSYVAFQSQYGRTDGQFDASAYNPLITGINETIFFDKIRAHHIKHATEVVLMEGDKILDKILTGPDSLRSFKNTLLKLDELYNTVSKVWSPLELLASVSDNEEIRISCDKSSLVFTEYFIELSINEALFTAVRAFSQTNEAKTLPKNRKYFLDSELRDFKHNGVGLSRNKQNELKKIQNYIAELSIDFKNNINSHTDTLFIEKVLMKGLSDGYKKERSMGNSYYAVDLSYPSFYTYMENAESDSIRKELRYKFLNRGMPDNIKILDQIISLRNQYAQILSYSSFAAYTIEEAMARTPGAVWEFLQDLKNKIQQKADWDTAQLLELKNHFTGIDDTVIYDWEKYFYENQILKSQYNVDVDEVRQYFQLDNVLGGIFTISERLLGIKYVEIMEPSVWHSDVKMYEMQDSNTGDLLGTFYLDLYPRENKYQHAAEYTIISGKKIEDQYQLPVACLVCNFPKKTADKPSLLSHDDVETFFHEFGHLIHDLLSKTELSSQAGTSVAMDFVEAPSQMLENWVWNKEALKVFARHYETGEVMPDSLLQSMVDARNLQSGNDLLQQIFYGILDLTLHENFDPAGVQSTSDLVILLQNTITNYPHITGTNQLASFDHLLDYSASYYGYLWSEVYAADMFSVFEANGIFDIESGMRFRQIILEKGGSENPMSLVENFLGRKPDNNAFLRKQDIAE